MRALSNFLAFATLLVATPVSAQRSEHVAKPNATESDATESDATESDATETDKTESDAPETDATETDATETDATETDATETDATESDATESDAPESDPTESDATESDNGHWGAGVVPRFAFDQDNGLGLGARGTIFWFNGDVKPYRTAISFQAFMTHKLVQNHFVAVDALEAFGLPLRINAAVGYFQSLTQNFCGYGLDVTCDPAEAEAEASRQRVFGPDATELIKRYYQLRFIRPYLRLTARYRFNQRPHRFEVFAGYRGHYYLPGIPRDLDDDGSLDLYTYKGSLYDQAYPGGEKGYASVVQAGVMLDDRDHEPNPHRGYWLEASLRGAHKFIGSAWSYAGVNATARIYAPLTMANGKPTLTNPNVVLASRYVVDVAMGELPLQEMIRVGGVTDYTAWGGEMMGRGLRVQRNPGRVKVLMQQELRAEVIEMHLLGQDWRGGVQTFVDGGYIGESLTALGQPRVSLGFGIGIRLIWGDNFVMRVDLAFSPDEALKPALYSGPDHLY